MDSALMAATVTAAVGFVTAAISVVKLINDKESKVTDYRQAWALSARASISDLVSTINAYAKELFDQKGIEVALQDADRKASQFDPPPSHLTQKVEWRQSQIDSSFERCKNHLHKIQAAYCSAQLHFKSNDLRFSGIEDAFSLCQDRIKALRMSTEREDWPRLCNAIHESAQTISSRSRDLLDSEWKDTKKGEKAYQWAVRSSIGLLVVALVVVCILIYKVFGEEPRAVKSDVSTRVIFLVK